MIQIFSLFLALSASQEAATAFTHVTVLPMDVKERLPDHTVLVRGDRIVEMGPSTELLLPADVREIDGSGKYLMPGLVDFHVHTWFPSDMDSFLVNGVTTVRNMFGSPMQLSLRDRIADGAAEGPTILTAGPIIDGSPPIWPGSSVITEPDQARAVVEAQRDAGYDFVKVYQLLSLESYDAIVAAAAEFDMPVMGHVPSAVGLEHVLRSRQRTLEHLFGYEVALQYDDEPILPQASFNERFEAWNTLDFEKLPALAEATRSAGVWNCPTLIVLQKRLTDEQVEAELQRDFMRYVSPQQKSAWVGMNAGGAQAKLDIQAGDAGRKEVVRFLHEAGCGILLGTDMGNPFVTAGFSLHEELLNLVDAGLSNYDALRAGTWNPALCMEQTNEFGAVRAGLRADLLLLDEDPLKNVEHAARPVGVMVRGSWLSREDLDQRLANLELGQ